MGVWSSRPRRRQVTTSELHPGDILLVRQSVAGFGCAVDPSVLRGVAVATTRNFYTTQRFHVQGWTHCAVVVPVGGVLYIVQPSFDGLHLSTAARRIRALAKAGAHVAVRQLRVPFTPAMHRVMDALSAMVAQGFRWDDVHKGGDSRGSRAQQAQRERGASDGAGTAPPPARAGVSSLPTRLAFATNGANDGSADGPQDGAGASSAGAGAGAGAGAFGAGASNNSEPATGTYHGAVTPPRTKPSDGLLVAVPPSPAAAVATQQANDALALQAEFAAAVVPRLYASLCQTPPQLELEMFRAFRMVDTKGTGFIARRDVPRVLKAVHGSTIDFERTLRVLRLLPSDEVGVTVDDLLLAWRRRPARGRALPLEHDAEAMLCGEFVAFVYEKLGLLPPRPGNGSAAAPPLAAAKSHVGVSLLKPSDAKDSSFRVPGGGAVPLGGSVPWSAPPGNVPAIDYTCGWSEFFSPASFSSLHEPPLALTRGHLDPEATVVGPHDPRYAAAVSGGDGLLPWAGCVRGGSKTPRVDKMRVLGY